MVISGEPLPLPHALGVGLTLFETRALCEEQGLTLGLAVEDALPAGDALAVALLERVRLDVAAPVAAGEGEVRAEADGVALVDTHAEGLELSLGTEEGEALQHSVIVGLLLGAGDTDVRAEGLGVALLEEDMLFARVAVAHALNESKGEREGGGVCVWLELEGALNVMLGEPVPLAEMVALETSDEVPKLEVPDALKVTVAVELRLGVALEEKERLADELGLGDMNEETESVAEDRGVTDVTEETESEAEDLGLGVVLEE